MKQLIAILLCFVTVVSLFSCNNEEGADEQNENQTKELSEANGQEASSEEEVASKYFKLERRGGRFYYEIYDKQGMVVQSKLVDRPTAISMIGETVVDIQIGRGQGLPIHTYYDVETNRFSREYTRVVAASGTLVAYHPSSSAYSLAVCDMFDPTVFERAYQFNGSVQSASFGEGEKELIVVYGDKFQIGMLRSTAVNVRYEHSFDDYDSILRVYRTILDDCAKSTEIPNRAEALGLTSANEVEWYQALAESATLFYPGKGKEDVISKNYKGKCGYALRDLNLDGVDELVLLTDEYSVLAIFSTSNGTPTLLATYTPDDSCMIDGDGLLHRSTSLGANRSAHTVYRISNGGAFAEKLVEYGTNGIKYVDGIRLFKYYRAEGNEQVTITEAEYQALVQQYGTYLDAPEGAEKTKESSGLTFTSLFTQDELAQETFCEVLVHHRKVYELESESYQYLMSCKTPYWKTYLSYYNGDIYGEYVDMDGDGVRELVINCGGFLVLRYYEGTVYVHPFTFRQMSYVYTDGSFGWMEDAAIGESRLVFDGLEVSTQEIWRIVNDGEPDAEYYLEGRKVTKEELSRYVEAHPKTRIEGIPIYSGK